MDAYRKFISQYRIQRFGKGEIIIHQEEVPPAAFVVKSGIVKTYNLTARGEEKPITFHTRNEVFPVSWTFGKLRRSEYFYEAFTACEVYVIPQQDYQTFLKTNPDSLYEIFDQFVNRYIGYQMRVSALEQSRAHDKILATLRFLTLRFGKTITDDEVRIDLPLTQQDLANFMGLTRETTGLELKKLERKGILSHRNHKYAVKTKKLSELLGEDYVPPPKTPPKLSLQWLKRLR